MRSLASAVLLLALLPGCAATSLLGYKLSPDYPDDGATETLELKGLAAPVLVLYDAQGVPHVDAKSIRDLARAVGFVQGRARFFQMDMMRRLARGRVSELVGEQPLISSTTVEYDRTMRGWEIEARATADLAKLPPEQRATLEAFSDGVNQAVRRWTPLEYRLLRVDPEPWTPGDSLAIGVLNVWTVTHNYQQEAVRLLLAMHGGVDRMQAIYPSEPMRGDRTVALKQPGQPLPPAVVEELAGLFPVKFPEKPAPVSSRLELDTLLLHGGASNAWVVSGARTKSGKPMVANDPHLSHFLPGMMFQMHLKGPELDVIGITVPGLPWVLSGHNERVAWSITSTMADVIDLAVEKEDPGRTGFVLHEGHDCALTAREEVLRVRDGSTFTEKKVTFRRTCNGPLYNDLQPALFPQGSPLVAIRWRVQGLERALDVLLRIDRARSAEELGAAVAELPSSYNTYTVADVDGHIGSFLSGEMPARPNHRGTFPVPGWVGRYEYQDWVKGAQVPHALDPEDGVLAHGNNLMADPGDPAFTRIHVDAAPPFRIGRIISLAKATPKHDLASFKRMLADTYSLRAQGVAPLVLDDLRGAALSPKAKEALALLATWDFDARADRPEAAIFFSTYRFAAVAALEDELPPDAVRFFLAQRYSTNTSDLWFEDPQHVVWDDRRTPEVERRAQVVAKAFEAAVKDLSERLGDDVAAWRWGALHWHRPMHAFGGRSALDGTVNLERMEAGGELDSVWKSHFDLGNERAPFKVVAGPVYRHVVDLADVAHAWWTVDTGTSGWPLSPHYGDQYETWKKGELSPMVTSWDELKRAPHGQLSLVP